MKKNLSTGSRSRGFTLIELLVVIAIIGLLSTLAVVALNSARQKARDAKRVADVKQVQTALELYFNDAQGYPIQTVTLGESSAKILCWGSGGTVGTNVGFLASAGDCDTTGNNTYMGLVPSNPLPAASATGVYQYASGDSDSYIIYFALEGKTGGLDAGLRTASQNGMQ